MSAPPWTIDSIAYALPHPDLRQSFLREAHLAPRWELDAVLDRWERFAVRWKEEAEPRIERVRSYYREHGKLPPEYDEADENGENGENGENTEETARTQQAFRDWRSRKRTGGAAGKRKGSSAA